MKTKNEIKDIFDNIVDKYDKSNEVIDLKYNHTFKVADKCEEIAKYLNLSEYEIYIAYLIGILHDIGRFEQVKQYNTLVDTKNMNHGEYGYELLKSGVLYDFIDDEKYSDIILNCVRYHNAIMINEDIDEYPKLFLKIIRDADKVDIYRVVDKMDLTNNMIEDITDYSYECVMNEQLIKYENITDDFELVVVELCFVYDMNYKYSFEYIYKNNYINIIIDRHIYSDIAKIKIEKIRDKINKYIEERIKL